LGLIYQYKPDLVILDILLPGIDGYEVCEIIRLDPNCRDVKIIFLTAKGREIYTAEPWEFTLDDVNFVQALAQIAGGAINMARYVKGLKSSIEVLKTMQEIQTQRSTRRTPYEGVPISVSSNEFLEKE